MCISNDQKIFHIHTSRGEAAGGADTGAGGGAASPSSYISIPWSCSINFQIVTRLHRLYNTQHEAIV